MSNSARCYQLPLLFLRIARSFLSDFNQNLNFFWQVLVKAPQKLKFRQNPFSAIRRRERQTEIHYKLKAAFRKCMKTLKKSKSFL